MNQRVELIDSLRGFSLFGILLANLLIFQYGMIGKDYIEGLSFIDRMSYYFTKIFVESSSMPIFTFLFGYSLIKLVESIKRRQRKTRWVLIRRAIALIAIGYIHSTFIWEGDILFFYGGMMFLLLLFIYVKPKYLLMTAAFIFVTFTAMSYDSTLKLSDAQNMDTYLEKEMAILSNGTYAEIVEYRGSSESGDVEMNSDDMDSGFVALFLLPVLPMFFVGMACAKLNLFRQPDQEKGLYKKLSLLVIVGLVLKSFAVFGSVYSGLLNAIGGPLLAIGYIAVFAYFYQSSYGTKLKTGFTAVGKLALSNYLLQSVICTFIFYGYGFGLFGTLGTTYALLIGLVIYVGQVYGSQLYLRRFSRGPVEYVLRLWTNLSWDKKKN